MAHRVLGIDIGSYSVKVAVAEVGFRKVEVTDMLERRLPHNDFSQGTAINVAYQIVKEAGLLGEAVAIGLPGDQISFRVLDFGFSGIKRADLEKAVGAELEGELPQDLEDIVYDFETIPVSAMKKTIETQGDESSDRTETNIQQLATGTRVLAAATAQGRIGQVLSECSLAGIETRQIIVAGTVYPHALSKTAFLGTIDSKREPVLVVDVGHRRTTLTVMWGDRVIYCRAISRGGMELTKAIANVWRMDFQKAEDAKHSDGFIASQTEPSPSDAWTRVSDVLKKAFAPVLQNIRQTNAACRSANGIAPTHVLLCGGGARLRGLTSYVTEELGLPVSNLNQEEGLEIVGASGKERGVGVDVSLIAHGVALEAASSRPRYDLRKGPFSYRADLSVLRSKMRSLSASALILLSFLALNAYATLYQLRKEEAFLRAELEKQTQAVFGKLIGPEEVKETLEPKKLKSPFPKLTAYDQLMEISAVLSPKKEFNVDITELDIKEQKISLKGSADTAATIDKVEESLSKIECFDEIKRGKVFGQEGDKQFSMTISSKCMFGKKKKGS